MQDTTSIRRLLTGGIIALIMLYMSTAVVWAGPNQGNISLSAGVDFPTAYYFRGIIQEDEDFIAQPYGEVGFSFYKGNTGLSSFGATLGIWNSFHAGPSGATGATSNPKSWYEADLYGGISFGFADVVNLGLSYIAYTSPNGSFSDVHELDITLGLDDSGMLGAFALSPSITLAFELDGQADGGNDEGVYLQLGIEPGYDLVSDKPVTLRVSLPLTLALSLGDYYERPSNGKDETFGFFDLGIAVNVGLGFIPEAFGQWSFAASGHFLFFGGSLEEINGQDSKALGIFGLSMAY